MRYSNDTSSLGLVCSTQWRYAQLAVWLSTKRVVESEMMVQRYWEAVEESFLGGNEEVERANTRYLERYWQSVEA